MGHRVIRALASLVVLVLLVSGCTARRIREAQDHFNRAAATEQQIEAAPPLVADGLRGSAAAAADYAVAKSLLDQELASNESALREENLLGTALVLEALCIWRLEALSADADVGAAATTSKQSGAAGDFAAIEARIAQSGVVLGTRDRVLLKALPGLRDHDRALRATDYATAKRFFESAVDTLDDALVQARPPQNHPVRVYVRLAQMRSLRAWLAANYAMNVDADPARQRESQAAETTRVHEGFHRVADAMTAQAQTSPGLKAQVQELAKAIGTSWPR